MRQKIQRMKLLKSMSVRFIVNFDGHFGSPITVLKLQNCFVIVCSNLMFNSVAKTVRGS